MKTKSAKAKGRALQNWVLEQFLEFEGKHLRVAIMGEKGSDIKSSDPGFPYAIECKNQETIGLWKAWEQVLANKEKENKSTPILFVKKNRQKPLAIVEADFFLILLKHIYRKE